MDDIFTDEELKAQEQQPGQEEETAEQKAERERDELGRFKAKEDDAPPAEDGATEDGKSKTVPHQAFHAEREKRKALEAELGPLKEQLAALAKMRETVASRKPAELPAADDPAAIEHLTKRLSEVETGQTRLSQHLDTQAINAAEIEQIGSYVIESEAKYRTEKPDYDEAIKHLTIARANELREYGLNRAQIAATISEEATEITRAAIAMNRNPAEMAYQIATFRGYRPNQEEKPNGQDSSVAQRTLDAIAEARKQGKSLGGAGGSTPKTLNAEAVLQMSPEEFDALYSTPEGKAMIDRL